MQVAAAVVLVVSFFLPWVDWDGSMVKGMDMATGNFFGISDARFGVANPFPKTAPLLYAFWIIPLFGLISAGLALVKKKTVPFAYIAGAASLALVTIYILFSNTLIDLGAGQSVTKMLKPSAYIHAIAAIILIITAYGVKTNSWKIAWLLLGPVIAFASFKIGEKYVMGETHKQTENVKADYTVLADALIREFMENDTAANHKYVEKMLVVEGKISALDIQPDSSATLKFADSTGSYAIFSFEKTQLPALSSIKAGDQVSVKGVCSGSIFSEILGTTSISFKRATLYNK